MLPNIKYVHLNGLRVNRFKKKTYVPVIFTVQVTDYKLKQTSFHWIKLALTNDDKIWSFYHQRVS
jgi:hypothetical protein